MRKLSARMRTEQEIRDILKRAAYDDEEIEAAIAALVGYGYLNADRYCGAYFRYAKLPGRAGDWDARCGEREERATPEAKFYKALDRLEAVIQHNEAPLSTWLDLERELNLTYGVDDCAPFAFLAEVRELSNEETRAKLASGEYGFSAASAAEFF